MITADQLEGVTVWIAEVEALVVSSPVNAAFNGNAVLGKMRLPVVHFRRLHGKSDMHGPGAIVRRNGASRDHRWRQRALLFEEEKNLVLGYLQRPEPIVLEDTGKAEDLAVPVCSAINISDIKASFDNSACCRNHEGLQLFGGLTSRKVFSIRSSPFFIFDTSIGGARSGACACGSRVRPHGWQDPGADRYRSSEIRMIS